MKLKKNVRPTAPLESADFFIPAAPRLLVFSVFCVSFLLPNLIFSGEFFFSTLHLMKWTLLLGPLAILGIIAGFRILRYGTEMTRFRLDGFAALWLVLLLFTSVQPLWTPPRSFVTFIREWFFFASLWLLYALALNTTDKKMLRVLLWGALLNAAISVLFAELQIRGMNGPYFFILDTPGNYIANTGQQNMFALWMAIAGAGGAFLFLSTDPFRQRPFQNSLLFVLLGVVFHGLIASTSRSGILSLTTAFLVLALFFLRNEGKRHLPKIVCIGLLFVALTGVTVFTNQSRGAALTAKLEDVVEKPLSIANRDSIWASSWTMFTQHPLKGVGLGQYKWHYVDATKEMAKRWPALEPKYTHWAHNEFLQWMAEGGIIGAVLMFCLWLWWGTSLFRVFFRKTPVSPEAIWGSALVALFFFNALWTRPFHRIENAVWLALAFAVTNREILLPLPLLPSLERFRKSGRLLGGVICLASLAGLLYLGNGVYGDRMLRIAAESTGGDVSVIMNHFRKAFHSPMTRDLAEREVAYFSVRLGEATKNTDMIAEGLNALLRYFEKQPHVDDLNYLLRWARLLNDRRFIEHLEAYLAFPATNKAPDPISASSD